MGIQIPMERGNFKGEEASLCKIQRHVAAICAKLAEPIKTPFGI